jgi:hypothetical protein
MQGAYRCAILRKVDINLHGQAISRVAPMHENTQTGAVNIWNQVQAGDVRRTHLCAHVHMAFPYHSICTFSNAELSRPATLF